LALLFETADHIATITFNRPEAMNAMDPDTYRELSEAWVEVRDNPDIWVAIITGANAPGRPPEKQAFTAGADLKRTIPQTPELWHFWQTQEEQILNRGLEVWKPVIAAVNGYCLAGGMTLLFATDIRIASEHAVFGISEVKRGILPGNGGTQRAVRQFPYPVAMEMLLLGLGGCSSIDVILILNKGRQDVTDCVAHIEAERAPTEPKVFTRIHVHFVVSGRKLDPKRVENAIRLSSEKYCSASIMLGKTAVMTHDFEIVEVM